MARPVRPFPAEVFHRRAGQRHVGYEEIPAIPARVARKVDRVVRVAVTVAVLVPAARRQKRAGETGIVAPALGGVVKVLYGAVKTNKATLRPPRLAVGLLATSGVVDAEKALPCAVGVDADANAMPPDVAGTRPRNDVDAPVLL